MRKYKGILLSLVIIMGLSACSNSTQDVNSVESGIDENVSAEEIEVSYPVTDEYNDKFVDVMNEFNDYIVAFSDHVNLQTITEKDIEDIKNVHKDMLIYLNSYEIIPTTEIEHEADSFVQKMLYHMEQHVNYSLKYVDTKDNVYLELKRDEYDEVILNAELVDEVLSNI